MFGNKIDIFNTKNTSNKKMLEKLYNYIEDYFENCEKYGLQVRDGQYQMALSTFDAIESYQHLIIEAGVGIGKSCSPRVEGYRVTRYDSYGRGRLW